MIRETITLVHDPFLKTNSQVSSELKQLRHLSIAHTLAQSLRQPRIFFLIISNQTPTHKYLTHNVSIKILFSLPTP